MAVISFDRYPAPKCRTAERDDRHQSILPPCTDAGSLGCRQAGAHEYEESIDEMKHADLLIKRLLFLDGEPRLEFDRLLIGKSMPDVLECDLRLEQLAMPQLREA